MTDLDLPIKPAIEKSNGLPPGKYVVVCHGDFKKICAYNWGMACMSAFGNQSLYKTYPEVVLTFGMLDRGYDIIATKPVSKDIGETYLARAARYTGCACGCVNKYSLLRVDE